MESFVNFSSSNIENFIKNKKLKENFSKLDFYHFRRIIKNLKRIHLQNLQNYKEKESNYQNENFKINPDTKNEDNGEVDFASPAMDEMIGNFLNETENVDMNGCENENYIDENCENNTNHEKFSNNSQIRMDDENYDFSFQNCQNNQTDSDQLKQLEEITEELKNNLFNIKGNVHKIFTHVNREKLIEGIEFTIHRLRFDVDLIIRDEECEYNIHMRRIKSDLMENLNKFSKNSTIFLTNMKAFIEGNGDEYKIIFRHRIDTKIYVQHSTLNDNANPLLFNNTIRVIYEMERKKLMDKKNLENSRISIQNSILNVNNSNFNYNETGPNNNVSSTYFPNSNNNVTSLLPNNSNNNSKGYFFNPTDQNIFDLTKSNEEEYLDIIDSSVLNKCISEIPNKFKDFSKLLIKNVENSIYSISNIMRINSNITYNDICGMIKSYKIEEKLSTIELVSLKDSNVIKILHYNKNMHLDLKENMIILIKNIASKVNKNFDLYLENPIETNTKIVGMLNTAEANKLKKFRFDKNKEFDCIIDLVKPVIRRSIQKFLLNIKKIYKVMAIYEKDSSGVIGFPDLRLIAKCLVDDGTFEAQVYFYDQTVVNLLRIDKTTLQIIFERSLQSCNIVIYDKHNTNKILTKDAVEDIKSNQYIAYCVPFSNLAKKHFYDNNYNRYFENLGQINNMKNKAMNLAFINGDILFEKTNNEYSLLPRPFLKALQVEILD